MRRNSPRLLNRVGLLAGTAGLALTLALGGYALAQTHGSGGSGHDAGTSHESGGGHDSTVSHEGSSSGKGKRKGASGERGGGHGGSLRDVFKQMEIEEALDEVRGQRRGQSGETQKGQKGGQAASGKGQRGGQSNEAAAEGEGKKGQPGTQAEVPSKPTWAGRDGTPSSGARDYGDLYAVLRDADGVPILDDQGRLQYLYVTADGAIECCIPYIVDPVTGDADPDFDNYTEIETLFSRTSVVRSPDRVLETQYYEFLKLLESATSVSLDDTNRLVLTTPDGVSTIDSPLISLAIYKEILTEGTLTSAADKSGQNLIDAEALLDKLPPELSSLLDGKYTADDLQTAVYFLAAAMDKSGSATVDMVVYLNTIAGVATTANSVDGDDADTDGDGVYVKFTDPNFTYDRSDTYATQTIDNIMLPGVISEGTTDVVTEPVDLTSLAGTTVTVTRDGESVPVLSYEIEAAPSSLEQLVTDLNEAVSGAGIVNFEVNDDNHLVLTTSTESDVTISGLTAFGLDGTINYIDGYSIEGTVNNIYETVFGGIPTTTTTTTTPEEDVEIAPGIESFTQAVDDARAVIDYVHTYSAAE